MNNIFNKTNAPYLITGALATLTFLTSGVFIAAPNFQFLAPVAGLNVSLPLMIGCAVVSFAVMVLSCVMIARNMNKTRKYDLPFEQVMTFDEVEGTQPGDQKQKPKSMADVLKESLNENSFKLHNAAGEQHFDNRANGTVGDAKSGDQEPRSMAEVLKNGLDENSFKSHNAVGGQHSDNRANGTAAPKPVPDIVQNALSGNSFKSDKVKEEQHAKVFAFASFVLIDFALVATNFLAGLIHSGVAVEGSGVALAHGDIYQFEAEKNSGGTNHLLQEAVQSKIVVFLKALKAGDEKGYNVYDEPCNDDDLVPDNSLSNIQAKQNRELQVYSQYM